MNSLSPYNPYRVDLDTLLKNSAIWNSFSAKLKATPAPVKAILFAPETMEFFLNLAYELGLVPAQSSELSRITRDVLLGDMFAGDITKEIAGRLRIPTLQAQNIRDRMLQELFAPAWEDIKKFQQEKFGNRLNKAPAPQSSPQQAPPQPVAPQTAAKSNTLNLRQKE